MNKRYFLSFLVLTAACAFACQSRSEVSETSENIPSPELVPVSTAIPEPDPSDSEDDALYSVERMPAYPGCENEATDMVGQCTSGKVIQFVSRNVHYPAAAIAQGIQGTVYVYYEVDQEGHIDNIDVKRGVHHLLDSTAVDVIARLPKHTPGTQRGKAVRVMFNVPVRFSLK